MLLFCSQEEQSKFVLFSCSTVLYTYAWVRASPSAWVAGTERTAAAAAHCACAHGGSDAEVPLLIDEKYVGQKHATNGIKFTIRRHRHTLRTRIRTIITTSARVQRRVWLRSWGLRRYPLVPLQRRRNISNGSDRGDSIHVTPVRYQEHTPPHQSSLAAQPFRTTTMLTSVLNVDEHLPSHTANSSNQGIGDSYTLPVRSSCNFCRTKKVKCDKTSPEHGGCLRCRREGLDCCYGEAFYSYGGFVIVMKTKVSDASPPVHRVCLFYRCTRPDRAPAKTKGSSVAFSTNLVCVAHEPEWNERAPSHTSAEAFLVCIEHAERSQISARKCAPAVS